MLYALIWPREAATPAEAQALAQGRTIIVYWDRHSGHEHEARVDLINEYNAGQGMTDGVYVRPLPVGFNALMEKMLTSIAGGAPPDICGMDGTIMAQLVAQGCFMPLEPFMAESEHLEPEDFFDYCWDAVCFDGHVWGVPTSTDTYCLLWNKQAFRKAGLDPERPPQSIEELEEYAAKLTIRTDRGFEQIGFLPWQPWDMTTLWSTMFGGDLYDEAAGEVRLARQPAMVRMFEWQRSFALDPSSSDNPAYAMDAERIMSFQKGFGAYMSANNPFYSGKVAMITEGEWQVTFIPKYAPELDWGVVPIPMPEGVTPAKTWSATCVADCIPKGCRNPEAAWAFIKWFYEPRAGGGPSPASDYCHAIHNIPTRPAEAAQERFVGEPRFRPFVDSLLEREVVSAPVTPVTQFYMDELERQRERVVFRKCTPEQALAEIDAKVNAELERARTLIERTAP